MAATTRPVEATDLDDVVRLVAGMGGHDDIGARPGVAQVFGAVLSAPHVRTVVATLDGSVVGYAEVHARPSMLRGRWEAWLAVLAVDAEHRGGGIGAALLEAVDDAAADLGCESVVLECSEWRDDSHRFYEREGFTDVGGAARRLARAVRSPAIRDDRPSPA